MSLPVPLGSPVVDRVYEELHSLPIRVRMVMIDAEFFDALFLPTHSPERPSLFPDVGKNSVGATGSTVWILDGEFMALPSAPVEQVDVVGWVDPDK